MGHDPCRRDALELDGLHEVTLGDVERRRPQHASHLWSVADPDGKDDEPDLRPDDRHEQQGEDELREGEDDVDGPHDDPVGPAPEVRRRDTGDAADDDAEGRRAQRHEEKLPPALEHPAQDVATEDVPAEQVGLRRLGERDRDEVRRRVRSDQGTDHRDEHDEAHQAEAEGTSR